MGLLKFKTVLKLLTIFSQIFYQPDKDSVKIFRFLDVTLRLLLKKKIK